MRLAPNLLFAARYRLIRQIGVGGFSVVWLAADEKADDLMCALKIYAPEDGLDEDGLRLFRREYTIAAGLNHPGLLKATYFDDYQGSPYLILPYCEKGSLASVLSREGPMSELAIAEVLYQVANALDYLHSKKILHQDIKPDNVLISDEGKYLLTDFGISSRLRNTLRKSTSSTQALTLAYAPPERFTGTQTIDEKGDVFSLGVMLFEIATGDLPWMGMGGAALNSGGEIPELPSGYSKGLEKLMQLCLQLAPANRPTAAELKQSAKQYLETGIWPTILQAREQIIEPLPLKNKRADKELKKTLYYAGKHNIPTQQSSKANKVVVSLTVLMAVIALLIWQPWEDQNVRDEKKERFLSLIMQAQLLEIEEHWPQALDKYREAFNMSNDSTLKQKIIALEAKLTPQQENKKEDESWAMAKQVNTVAAYTQYLIDYPEGRYKNEAYDQIRILEENEEQAKVERAVNEGLRAFKQENYSEAFPLLKYAIDHGSNKVFVPFGIMYVAGLGVEQNFTEAFKWFRKGAEAGDPDGQLNLGKMYLNGYGVAQNPVEAIKWFRKAANQGHSSAQVELGHMYVEGNGILQDHAEAVKWYQKAANQGNSSGQFFLGLMFEFGQGVTQDHNKALKWYHMAAEQGNPEAQKRLGEMYLNGRGVAQNHLEAMKWYRMAAEQDDDEAQIKLGDLYFLGFGVTQNYNEAINWYRMATEQGNPEAQNKLGDIFHYGFGVAQDYQEAVKWYTSAAEQGNIMGQVNLGWMYEKGKGVSVNLQEAIKWYRLAANQGDESAKKALVRLGVK
ncbi:MAG: protein kinase [Cyclobacteriaceae bacterium]|nr:protein kinase [Cyclobacteriaceae bacterium]